MISKTAGRLIQLVLMIGALLMCSHAFSQEPAYTIERLSLFVHDSAGVWEDMRIGETTSNLPPAMSVEFIPQGNPQAGLVWIWVLTNASTSDLQDLRVTALIDVDFNAEANTFFNETGARIALSAPEGHIPPDRWEISEPGYHHGNLLQRAPFGVLGNLSSFNSDLRDDAALALSLQVDRVTPGQVLLITARYQPGHLESGLLQEDADVTAPGAFQFYARLDASGVPECSGSDCPAPPQPEPPGCPDSNCPPGGQGPGNGSVQPIPILTWPGLMLLVALVTLLARGSIQRAGTLLIVLATVVVANDAQAVFSNGQFESRTFDAWTKIVGQNPGLQGPPPFSDASIRISAGGDRSRFSLVEGGLDPRAPHLVLPRQGNVTARLNNDQISARINGISQKGTLSESDRDPADGKLHVRFSYAAVLEDPGHEPQGQPYFHVLLTDRSSGKVLYDDFAYSNQPGRLFFTTITGGRLWRSTPFIDVDIVVPDSSLGHEIEVRVLAADCAHSGHAGYVYVDAFGSLAIPPQGSCVLDLAARTKPGNVQLTWQDDGAVAHAIYRADKLEGPYVHLGTTESRYATWLDRDVLANQRYYYSVRALDAEGREICASGEVLAVVPEHWSVGDTLNRPPRFIIAPNTQGDIRVPYSYSPAVVDPDGDALQFTLRQAPIGMTIDASGKLDWQPQQTGSYRVNLEVSDGFGHASNQAFSIEVRDGNTAPVITSQFPARVPAGVSLSFQILASDTDGDPLTYSIGSQAVGTSITAAGRVTWNNPQPGRYPVTIVVADKWGARATQQTVVMVQAHPEFVSRPVINATTGAPYSYTATATDRDGDTLRYGLSEGPAGMTINANTGELTWSPVAVGNYAVKITAKDPDDNTATQSFTLRVTAMPNRVPSINSVPVTFVAFPSEYAYNPSASDADGDNLNWTLRQAPPGMTINPVNGQTRWTFASTLSGLFEISLEVNDGRAGVATQDYVLQIPAYGNRAPTITSTPDTRIAVGTEYTYNITAADPDSDTLSYRLTQAPAAMTLNAALIRWTATQDDIGLHPVQLEVADTAGNLVTQNWSLEVVPAGVNRAPSIQSQPVVSAMAGASYAYQLSAQDPDGDALTYRLVAAPASMSIDAAGRIEWTVPAGSNGVFQVEIEVSDGRGGVARQSYQIGVSAVGNRPPAINSTPVVTATPGAQYSYAVSASDPDGDTLAISLQGAHADMMLTSADRLEWLAPADADGAYDVLINVADGKGGVAQQHFTIGVGAAGNRPPRISSQPGVSLPANRNYGYHVSALDPDGDPLVFKLANAPDGMSISPTGLIQWQAPAGLVGLVLVDIEVTDDHGGLARQVYEIVAPGIGNRAPRITSTPVTLASVDSAYTYPLSIQEPDGDPVSHALETAPAGMAINATGRIEWTPGANQTGEHTVTVTVSDDKGAGAVQTYTLFVQHASNRPPRITSAANLSATPGVPYSYQVSAADPDGDVLSYELPIAPVGMSVSRTGLVRWSSPVAGNHPVEIRTLDPSGAFASQTFTLRVGANRPPVITSIPTTGAMVGVEYRYTVNADDPDGDFLTYQLITPPPAWLSMSSSGVISGIPISVGTHAMVVRVSDGRASIEQSWNITVAAPPPPGALGATLSLSSRSVAPGETVRMQLMVNGGTAPYTVTSFRINNSPRTLDADLGTSFSSTTLGRYDVVATVRDSKNTSFTLNDWFSVLEPGDTIPPVARINSPGDSGNIDVTDLMSAADIVGTASDVQFGDYRLLISPAGKNQWSELRRSVQPVTDGALGRLEIQTIANGMYDIGLIVRDLTGNESSATITVAVRGDQKAAPLRLTFEDLSFNVEGLPLTVRRTYDSLRRLQPLDFGHGWSMDYQDVWLQTNGVPGRAWTLQESGSGFNRKLCARPGGARVASILMPDGSLEQFDLRAQPECVPILAWTGSISVGYTPRAGNNSGATLEALGAGDLRIAGGDLFDIGGVETFNPQQYRLTLRDGTQYTLRKDFGVQQIRDRNGNTLQFGPNGISHSGGWALAFTRDAQQRITRITGPDGVSVEYTYDGQGNLEQATDPRGAASRYAYANPAVPHGLTSYTDPLGRLQLKTDFDADGRILRQTDSLGRTVEIATNNVARTQSVRDRNGQTHTYTFDERGNITQITDPSGGITRFEFDANDNEIAHIDPLGRETRRSFDAFGNITGETDPLGRTTSTTYNASGQVSQTTDEAGRINRYDYSATGDLTRLTDPLGQVIELGYSVRGDLMRMQDAAGYATQYTYATQNGRLLRQSETNALGNATQFAYDTRGNKTRTTRQAILAPGSAPREVVTSQQFDLAGNLVSQTDSEGHTTTFAYDAANQLILKTEPLGAETRHQYNARGELVQTTRPDGIVETWQYDANGNETRHCLASLCTQTAYDALNRPTRIINPINGVEQSTYDAVGQMLSRTDERGNVTTFTHDALGRPVSETDPLGHVTSRTYDLAGQLATETDANGDTTEHDYDALGHRIETRLPNGSSYRFGYNPVGQRISETDAEGGERRFSHDPLGRLSQVTDPLGANTEYVWNALGQLLSQTDANGHATDYAYDRNGRRIARILPDGASETQQYDALGQLIAHTDFDGNATAYTFGTGGRLTRRFEADGSILDLSYDGIGRNHQRSHSRDGNLSVTFDGLSRITREATAHNQAPGAALNTNADYAWDATSNRTQVKHGSVAIQASWDARNQLEALTAPDGGVTHFDYDPAGNRTRIVRADGSTSDYRYDAARHLIGITHSAADGSELARFDYLLDGNGRRIQLKERIPGATPSEREIDYRYDAAGRLIEERITRIQPAAGTLLVQYTLDAVGNRLRRSDSSGRVIDYSYDTRDRLVQEQDSVQGLTTYTWNSNGQLVRKQTPTRTTNYQWDAMGRLIRVNDGVRELRYGYDAHGRRIKRLLTEGGQSAETHYLVDGVRAHSEILVERSRTGTGPWQESVYIHTPDGVGELLSETRAGQTLHYYADALGSTRLSIAADGTREAHHYDAFGNPETASPTRHRFSGEYTDPVSGFIHLRAREYDPRVGRFVTMDGFEGFKRDPVSRNAYVYAAADPVNNIDPSGYLSVASMGMAGGVSATLASIATASYGHIVRQLVFAGGRAIAMSNGQKLVSAAAHQGTFSIARSLAKFCLGVGQTLNKDCKPGATMFIPGDTTPEHRGLVVDAIMGGAPFSLNYQSEPHSRGWLKTKRGCEGKKADSTDCDEYPYASTYQGGEGNRAMVWTRIISASDNKSAGGSLSRMYSNCGNTKTRMNDGDQFFVLPLIGVPTMYLCK